MHPGSFTEESPPNSALPTSLDHGKTTVENGSVDAVERIYRFRDLKPYVEALEKVLPQLQISAKQTERFKRCGCNAWVVWSPSRHQYKLRTDTCKLRWCPKCHHQSAKRVTDNLTRALTGKPQYNWKFITLTTRASKLPLEEQIKHLRTSFRRLRQRKFFKANIRGGYAVLEITHNNKTKQWHPHLHIIADANYIPQKALSQEWLKASKDSFIVDIRKIRNSTAAVGYVAKYLGKLPELSLLGDAEKTSEWIAALKGTRLINRFGDLPEPTDEKFDDKQPADWQPVMRLATLLNSARNNDKEAIWLLQQINRQRHEEETDIDASP